MEMEGGETASEPRPGSFECSPRGQGEGLGEEGVPDDVEKETHSAAARGEEKRRQVWPSSTPACEMIAMVSCVGRQVCGFESRRGEEIERDIKYEALTLFYIMQHRSLDLV